MDTLNIVLMIILSAIIGFACGNVWGRENMRKIMVNLIDQIINNIKVKSASSEKKGE